MDDEIADMMARDIWSEYPQYTRDVWRIAVANEETQLGYWDWVREQKIADTEDAELT